MKSEPIYDRGLREAVELKSWGLLNSQMQWEQICSDRPNQRIFLAGRCEFCCRPQPREALDMYESANGQRTGIFQQSALPFCHGTRISSPGRFPSERVRSVGSLDTWTHCCWSSHSGCGVWLSCCAAFEQQPTNQTDLIITSCIGTFWLSDCDVW